MAPATPEQVLANPNVSLQECNKPAACGLFCCKKGELHHVLDQSFAVIRHGDRLDHVTKEWRKYPERQKFPNDTPLTASGFLHAREVADVLKQHSGKRGRPFASIVSSPYLRCAQTAGCIADKLGLKVHFDLDLGEIFDNVAMKGDVKDKHQHRSPEELDILMSKDFPHVELRRDSDERIKISGKLPVYPEQLEAARMRFCYKVNRLIKKAAAELVSVIIVTHGDAVQAVLSMLRQEEQVVKIPWCGYVIGERQVKVMKKDDDVVMKDEDVFEGTGGGKWSLEWHKDIEFKSWQCNEEAQDMHAVRTNHLQRLSVTTSISCMSYDLNAVQNQRPLVEALDNLGVKCDDPVRASFMRKASCNQHLFDGPRISTEAPDTPSFSLGKSSTEGGADDEPLSPRDSNDSRNADSWLNVSGSASTSASGSQSKALAKSSKVNCGSLAGWLCRMFV